MRSLFKNALFPTCRLAPSEVNDGSATVLADISNKRRVNVLSDGTGTNAEQTTPPKATSTDPNKYMISDFRVGLGTRTCGAEIY